MIPFNKPPLTGNEEKYVLESMNSSKISGDGEFTKECHKWFEHKLKCKKALLTTSCTHALEMTAMLLNIKEGDEVIEQIKPLYAKLTCDIYSLIKEDKELYVVDALKDDIWMGPSKS